MVCLRTNRKRSSTYELRVHFAHRVGHVHQSVEISHPIGNVVKTKNGNSLISLPDSGMILNGFCFY